VTSPSPARPRVYLETTVISYLTALPSRDVVRVAHQQITAEWWAGRDAFELFVSEAVLSEVRRGDTDAAARRVDATGGLPVLPRNSRRGENHDERHDCRRSPRDPRCHRTRARLRPGIDLSSASRRNQGGRHPHGRPAAAQRIVPRRRECYPTSRCTWRARARQLRCGVSQVNVATSRRPERRIHVCRRRDRVWIGGVHPRWRKLCRQRKLLRLRHVLPGS